ncbi:hypothetical protein [Pedobacter arcticus]|uniref:hypothetical protein n=1 Tax=Pedobacter arcticus TaxID=752140 RepID=UPI000377971B|nr:hypothetical protein [Pedobacter arcticus]
MKSSKVKVILTVLIFCIAIFSACGIKSDDLIGRWNYVSYEYTNKSLNKPLADIAIQKPYIEFDKDGKCKIVSSGKFLSEGTYYLENKIIRYTETLEDGKKRAIPFLIKSLTAKDLVFQTMDAEVKVITAVKE